MIKIGIVGHGFVGKAVDYGFTHRDVEKYIVDPKYGTSIENLPHDVDVVFVCVPTPMGDNGSILRKVIGQIEEHVSMKSLIVIKSTITPDIIRDFAYDGIVYNPEFLAEKNANYDFVNPQFHVFGGTTDDTKLLEQVYNTCSLCTPCHVFHVSHIDASFIKYGINTFLATKVTFFNQLYDTINKEPDANFAGIIAAIGSDERIGSSHTKVPGFDGKQGFGGACFPKDCAALVAYDNSLTLLAESIKINNQYRSTYELDEREKAQNVNYEQTQKEQ
jgi:nucleotide sugar dehydrogenase